MQTTSHTPTRNLPTFDDALPLAHGDEAFLEDIHAVLNKHGNLDRFGLCLIHDHFDVGTDEILLETNDPVARTLSLETVKTSDLGTDVKFTSWDISKWDKKELADAPGTAMTGCKEDKCKAPAAQMAMTGCKEDKCKAPAAQMAMTGCKEDKCKAPAAQMAMTGCKEDKCKAPAAQMAMTGCKEDKCKSIMVA